MPIPLEESFPALVSKRRKIIEALKNHVEHADIRKKFNLGVNKRQFNYWINTKLTQQERDEIHEARAKLRLRYLNRFANTTSSLYKVFREESGLTKSKVTKITGMSKGRLDKIESEIDAPTMEEADILLKHYAKTINLAYIAGLIDRGCSIKILREKPRQETDSRAGTVSPIHHERFEFHSVHKPLVELMLAVFKVGNISVFTSGRGGTPVYAYMAWHKNAIKALTMVRPYCRVKAQRIDCLIALNESKGFGGKVIPKSILDERERLYKLIGELP